MRVTQQRTTKIPEHRGNGRGVPSLRVSGQSLLPSKLSQGHLLYPLHPSQFLGCYAGPGKQLLHQALWKQKHYLVNCGHFLSTYCVQAIPLYHPKMIICFRKDLQRESCVPLLGGDRQDISGIHVICRLHLPLGRGEPGSLGQASLTPSYPQKQAGSCVG